MLHHAHERKVLDRIDPEPLPAMPNQPNVPFETESPAAAASVTIWKSMPQPVPGGIVLSGSGMTWLVRIISTVRDPRASPSHPRPVWTFGRANSGI